MQSDLAVSSVLDLSELNDKSDYDSGVGVSNTSLFETKRFFSIKTTHKLPYTESGGNIEPSSQ